MSNTSHGPALAWDASPYDSREGDSYCSCCHQQLDEPHTWEKCALDLSPRAADAEVNARLLDHNSYLLGAVNYIVTQDECEPMEALLKVARIIKHHGAGVYEVGDGEVRELLRQANEVTIREGSP